MEQMTTNYSSFKKTIASFFMAVFLIPTAALLIPEKAEAQTTATACGLGTVIGVVVKVLGSVETVLGVHTSRGSGATGDSGSVDANWTEKIIKCVLKPLAQKMIASIIRQMGANVVNWVNGGGDKGRPLFVTDFKGMLNNAADEAIGSYIEGSDLGFLCKQGGLDLSIRLALSLSYARPATQQIRCRLSDIKGNIKNSIGSWDDWITLSGQPQNNFYGGYVIARSQLGQKVLNAVNIKDKKVAIGGGFLDQTTCPQYETQNEWLKRTGTDPKTMTAKSYFDGRNCAVEPVTTTPGKTIAAKLDSSLASEDIKAAVADDIDQVLSAVLSQLGQKLIGGVKGLLGLSKGSTYSYGTPYQSSYQSQYYGVVPVTGTVTTGSSVIDQYGSGTLDPNEATAVNNVNDSGASELTTSTTDTAKAAADAQADNKTNSVAGNIAMNHPTSQTGNGYANSEASNAINGVYGVAQFPPAVTSFTPNPSWQIDLESVKDISSVRVWKPVGLTAIASLGTIQVIIRDISGTIVFTSNPTTVFDSSPNPTVITVADASGNPIKGQTVEIQRINNYDSACVDSSGTVFQCYEPLALDEVQIIGK